MDQMRPPSSNPPPFHPPSLDPLPKLYLPMQEIGDDEPTIKMKVPPHLLAQTRGPNWGLIGAILFCLAFWGSIGYFIFR